MGQIEDFPESSSLIYLALERVRDREMNEEGFRPVCFKTIPNDAEGSSEPERTHVFYPVQEGKNYLLEYFDENMKRYKCFDADDDEVAEFKKKEIRFIIGNDGENLKNLVFEGKAMKSFVFRRYEYRFEVHEVQGENMPSGMLEEVKSLFGVKTQETLGSQAMKIKELEKKIEKMDEMCKSKIEQVEQTYVLKMQGMQQDHNNEMEWMKRKFRELSSSVSSLKGNVESNTQSISTNKSSIGSSGSSIESMKRSLSKADYTFKTLKDSISSNKDSIDSNESKLSSLQWSVDSNKSVIESNKEKSEQFELQFIKLRDIIKDCATKEPFAVFIPDGRGGEGEAFIKWKSVMYKEFGGDVFDAMEGYKILVKAKGTFSIDVFFRSRSWGNPKMMIKDKEVVSLTCLDHSDAKNKLMTKSMTWVGDIDGSDGSSFVSIKNAVSCDTYTNCKNEGMFIIRKLQTSDIFEETGKTF